MKSPLLKLPFSRHRHSPQSFPKFVLLVVLILVFFTKITLYDALVASSAGAADEDAAAYFVNLTECDIFRGKWKWDSEMPYYTNKNCFTIQEHQNCLKYGRPDLSFLKWRWKPESCELPRFDAARFLNLVRHKSLAFVGDSLARNHMQSLLCVLSKVNTRIKNYLFFSCFKRKWHQKNC